MKRDVKIWEKKWVQLSLLTSMPALLIGSFLVTVAAQEKIPRHLTSQAGVSHRAQLGDHNKQPISTLLRSIPQAKPQTTSDVAFEVCSDSQSWQRPSELEQQQQLQTLPQYASGLGEESTQSLMENFWGNDLFSFTSYGLSARIEPIYLTGLWSNIDQVWSCYEEAQVNQLNAGEMAEVWVLSHRVSAIQWQGGRYVMVVEPAPGFQLIQFPRWESQATLPLEVLTVDGSPLNVVASDLASDLN